MENILVDNVKVMAGGDINLPKDIRAALGIDTGDKVALIKQGNQVVMMNSAVYAMQTLQRSMEGEAEKARINDDEDVIRMIMEMRSGEK